MIESRTITVGVAQYELLLASGSYFRNITVIFHYKIIILASD